MGLTVAGLGSLKDQLRRGRGLAEGVRVGGTGL